MCLVELLYTEIMLSDFWGEINRSMEGGTGESHNLNMSSKIFNNKRKFGNFKTCDSVERIRHPSQQMFC